MDEFLTVFDSAQMMGTGQILSAFLMSFVLCSVLATVYSKTFQGLSYSRAFVHTLILGGIIVAMMIMAIGNNLARGLGILGTLAIIRFRTPVRDPRDMMFLFSCLGVGIACGAGTFNVAILGTIFISGTAILLHVSPFASRREYEGLLRFTHPSSNEIEDAAIEVLKTCCSSFYMIAMREIAQGDMLEFSYQVKLIDPSYQQDLIEKLTKVEDVTGVNLLMQKATVEL